MHTKAPYQTFTLDPQRMAALETALWRAYYDRNIPLGLILMVRLSREQFKLSWTSSLRGAYHVLRASIAWAPPRNRPEVARRFLRRFYSLVARERNLTFDPDHVAGLELRYWRLHRDLVGVPDKLPLVEALAELHAEIIRRPIEEMLPSATHRARATRIIDEITSRRSPDPAKDWRRVEENLLLAYRHMVTMLPGS